MDLQKRVEADRLQLEVMTKELEMSRVSLQQAEARQVVLETEMKELRDSIQNQEEQQVSSECGHIIA